MNRRQLLASTLLPLLEPLRVKAWQSAPPMKIAKIETIYWPDRNAAPWWPHWTWVRLTTADGLTAVGETYPRNSAEAALIHSVVAKSLLGRDPRDIDRIWAGLYRMFAYEGAGGIEMHAISAIDLALWDLLGKSLNTPVYRLIGGKSNPRVRLYNTCFDHKHNFNTDPDKIMREVMDGYGIQAIKIWPFDRAAIRNQNQFITPADIDEALAPVRKLRDAFGDKIEILMEFHSMWNLTSAIRIAHALEPYKPMWLEDMLYPVNFAQYRQLAEATSLPLTISERLSTRMSFAEVLESRAAKFIMLDLCWCGGLSEGRKIANMAEAYHLPIAPHTAAGPLLFYASTHLTTAATNVWIQESCQRFYERDWPAMLENPIVPKGGTVAAPELPGFGMVIKPEVWRHPAAIVQTSTL